MSFNKKYEENIKSMKDFLRANKDKYILKKVKTFRGREGEGFNADLYAKKGSKYIKIAVVDDSADGGCYNWVSYQMDKELFGQFKKDVLACQIHELIEPLDSFMDIMVEEHIMKKQCKNKILIVLKSHKSNEHASYNMPYNPKNVEFVKKEHGDDLVEIINERFLR